MNLQKMFLQKQTKQIINKISQQIEVLPFYVKEIGYSNEHHFVRGATHNHLEYLAVFALSNMTFTKYNTKYPIHAYDLVLSSCNTNLDFTQSRRKEQEYFYMVIAGKHAQLFYNMVRTSNYIHHTNHQNNMLELFTSLLNIDYKTDPLLGQLKAGSLLYEFFQKLYQINSNILEAREASPAQKSAVQAAISFIEKNYSQKNLDVDLICENVGFSKYYFCKVFKEHTGVTIHQYVTEYRINKSKDLLTYSKLTITNVASSVGYKNSLTYTRSFERLVHMTPSEYREKY